MLQSVSNFGESTSGIAALGLDGQAFLIQLLTFVIVFLILRRFAFKPILKVLAERRALIESGVNLGEEMKQEKIKLSSKIDSALADARARADAIIAEGREDAKQVALSIEETALKKAEAITKAAEDRRKLDLARDRQNLESEMFGLVAEATEALLEEKVDIKKDAALIKSALRHES